MTSLENISDMKHTYPLDRTDSNSLTCKPIQIDNSNCKQTRCVEHVHRVEENLALYLDLDRKRQCAKEIFFLTATKTSITEKLKIITENFNSDANEAHFLEGK